MKKKILSSLKMDFEKILENEFLKIDQLKNLKSQMEKDKAFDIEDVQQIETYIDNREKLLCEKQRVLEEVVHLRKLIEKREQILQQFEDQTNILTNTNLIKYFKTKQKQLIDALNSLCH